MEFFRSGLFSTKKVGNFPFPSNKIVEVTSAETVDSAFRKLVQHNILSAPCWDEEKQQYLGFFDITDALALIYTVDLLITAIPDSLLQKSTVLRLAASGSACPDSSDLLVGAIFEGDSDRDIAWNPVTNDCPMSQVIFLLATSTRRVPVIDPTTNRVVKILSQSLVTEVLNDTLKEMEAKGETLPELFSKTPAISGGFGLRDVLFVDAEEQRASDAFRKIIENGVSAVAVLDDEKKLLSSITTKDIRLFKSLEEVALQRLSAEQLKRDSDTDVNPEHLALMDLTCGDFVSIVERTASSKGITRAPAIVVSVETPIRKIISLLAITKKHRVFVVDESRHPIGVISISDISKLLVTDPN